LRVDPTRRYSPRWLALFGRYVAGYARRHFTAVRAARDGLPPPIAGPTVFYANHPGWWDPLVLLLIAGKYYRGHEIYAPIDADALRRYPLLERFGFFGIQPDSAAGARDFLRASKAVLDSGRGIVALTAQGRFSDVRPRPVAIKGGLALLLRQVPLARAVPVAIEYAFWNERLPECLIRFGDGVGAGGRNDTDVQAALGQGLERTLDGLAALSIARDERAFEPLLASRAGAGWLADLPQHLRAWLRGRRFDPAHGAIRRGGADGG
jgi:1-acyl-sn-glycerol-3-phosphate acyltransferase